MNMNRLTRPFTPAINRRAFVASTAASLGGLLWPGALRGAPDSLPRNNPLAQLKLAWAESIHWANVVDVTQVPGQTLAEKLATAQAGIADKGGGVVYFPPGVYQFTDSIRLKNSVVLRGAEAGLLTQARDEGYAPPSRFEFPQYVFKAEGNGTPIESAFKGIYLENPASDSNCGVVNLAINCRNSSTKSALIP